MNLIRRILSWSRRPSHGLGAIASPPDARDFPISHLYAARGVTPEAAPPPDYVVPAELPPILDQDGTPQCVAYSTAGLKLYEDRIDQKAWFPFDEGRFFKAIGGGPNGAVVRNAFKQMLAVGYALVGGIEAALHKIAAYYAIPITPADLQAAIMAFGPIVLGMTWYAEFDNPDATGTVGAPKVARGGHAIMCIGWRTVNGQLQFRLRNSWGSGWGLNGECYLPATYLSTAWEAWKAVDQIVLPREVIVYSIPYPRNCTTKIGSVAGYNAKTLALVKTGKFNLHSGFRCDALVTTTDAAGTVHAYVHVTNGTFAGLLVSVNDIYSITA